MFAQTNKVMNKTINQANTIFEQIAAIIQSSKALRILSVGATFGGSLWLLRNLWIKIKVKIYKYPPQLVGIPFLGSLFTLIIFQESFSLKILPNYGDIVGFNLANVQYYRINNNEILQQILDLALDRHKKFTRVTLMLNLEPNVAIVNNDRNWLYRRRLLSVNLVSILNKRFVERNILNTLHKITFPKLDSLENGQLWYSRKCIQNVTINSIYLAMFGNADSSNIFDLNNKRGLEYLECIHEMANYILPALLYDQLPRLIGEPLLGNQFKKYDQIFKRLYSMSREDLNSLRSNNNDHETLVTSVLKTIEQDKSGDKVNDDVLVGDIVTLFLAGVDTSSHVMEVGILLLAKYPNVQKTVFKQLRAVCDSGSINSNNNNKLEFVLSKVNQCCYLRAFIYEALRLSVSLPNGLPRCSDKDIRIIKYKNNVCEIDCDYCDNKNKWESIKMKNKIKKYKNMNLIEYDYIIPKNSQIEANMTFMSMYDKNIWSLNGNDTKVPNLDYWLKYDKEKKDVKFKSNNKNMIVFSVGKRNCMGQSLAMKQLLLFFGNLILNYKILAPKNDPQSMDIRFYYFGLATSVEPQIPVQIEPRIVSPIFGNKYQHNK